jgi:nitrogen fixation/metabolism regulation signal transduction histidine kinase
MEFLNKYGAAILTAIAALVVVILLCIVFWGLKGLVPLGDHALPLVAIGGVVVLILLLTAVATMFSILGLTNKDQAMGLPEGSIRAVIALSLIVLFAILSVFLFQSISVGGARFKIDEMSTNDRTEFIRSHTNARDIQSSETKGKPGFYDVTYRSANPASEDFAKQLLVLLGTLMTAITSFYLGAGTVTSAVKAGSEASTNVAPASAPASTIADTKPKTHSIATDGSTLHFEATGTNLGGISDVKLANPGASPISGTKVSTSATKIAYDFDVTNASPGTWSIEASEDAKPAKAIGSLTITT